MRRPTSPGSLLLAGLVAVLLLFAGAAFSPWTPPLHAATQQNQGAIINNVAYGNLNPITSDDFGTQAGAIRLDVYCFATTAGTLQPVYVDLNGNARNMGPALNIAASDLTTVTFQRMVPKSRFIFTPASQPGTIECDAYSPVARY